MKTQKEATRKVIYTCETCGIGHDMHSDEEAVNHVVDYGHRIAKIEYVITYISLLEKPVAEELDHQDYMRNNDPDPSKINRGTKDREERFNAARRDNG